MARPDVCKIYTELNNDHIKLYNRIVNKLLSTETADLEAEQQKLESEHMDWIANRKFYDEEGNVFISVGRYLEMVKAEIEERAGGRK